MSEVGSTFGARLCEFTRRSCVVNSVDHGTSASIMRHPWPCARELWPVTRVHRPCIKRTKAGRLITVTNVAEIVRLARAAGALAGDTTYSLTLSPFPKKGSDEAFKVECPREFLAS